MLVLDTVFCLGYTVDVERVGSYVFNLQPAAFIQQVLKEFDHAIGIDAGFDEQARHGIILAVTEADAGGHYLKLFAREEEVTA